MKTKKSLVLIAFLLISYNFVNGHSYKWATGLRAGAATAGAAMKYNHDRVVSLEGMLAATFDGGFVITGLYERNVVIGTKGFYFYYGGGLHIGQWDDDFSLGVDPIAGFEYRFHNLPMAISLDYKPSLDIVSDSKFRAADAALGIKLTF